MLGRQFFVYFVIGDNANFNFLNLLRSVNCNFAQTISIDSMHRHGGCIKISHGNSCNLKKLAGKQFNFFDYLKNGVEFLHSICAGLRRLRTLQNGCKKFGDFLRTFPPEGTKLFYRGSL